MELTAFRLENAPKSSKILCFSSKSSNFIVLPPKNCIYNTKMRGAADAAPLVENVTWRKISGF